ncbi:hypothetical protein DL89DRAFT_265281 [Linderina pennispora]|uniref:Uncharacterized protein n=1 Tax=Linderina pennispora TaxID=61395 RepID=A0A1Y1WHT8_9FUNG|nr:uncharacterized protein DL89DRAFT_265281 [Linderina pennispora]ORX73141.1 hypothetical protein DL89DRAFT_265281 [Linderina pennispora]
MSSNKHHQHKRSRETRTSQSSSQVQQEVTRLTRDAMVSEDKKNQLSEIIRRTGHSTGAGHIDTMYQYNRMVAPGILKGVGELCELFETAEVVSVPDFALNISGCFARYVSAVDITDADTGELYEVSAYAINYAVRPELVSQITEWIISHGRHNRLSTCSFSGVPIPEFDLYRSSENLSTGICFVREPRSSSSAASLYRDNPGYSAGRTIKPLLISGPWGIGKSHLMFGAAAKLACMPKVVVIYIGDAGDLIVQPGSNDQYIAVIEHIACAFINYPVALDAISRWYRNSGTSQANLAEHTNLLLKDIHGNQLVIDILGLGQSQQFMTVVSTSNANKVDQVVGCTVQCIISGVPTNADIANIAFAVHPSLELSAEQLERASAQLDNHAVDVVSALTRLSNYVERRSDAQVSTGLHSSDPLRVCINEQILERNSRILRQHSAFVTQTLSKTISRFDVMDMHRVGPEIGDSMWAISTKTGDLRAKLLRIKLAIFREHHGLSMEPNLCRDLQFVVPDYALGNGQYASAAFCHRNDSTTQPAAACGILYRSYFSGTVHEQFQWIFDGASLKRDIDTPTRLRYFDLSFLELEQLVASACALSDESKMIVSIDFGRRVFQHRHCTTFGEATTIARAAAERMSKDPPRYLPVNKNAEIEIRYSTMLYFPTIEFDKEWKGKGMKTTTYDQGSFMLALTRIDWFTNGRYTTCKIEATWIANDPIELEIPLSSNEPAAHKSNQDYDMVKALEYENSWSARAIGIFSGIGQRESFGNVSKVDMLVVTRQDRVDGIIRGKHRLTSMDPMHMSRCGLVAIETISKLRRTLSYI